MQVAPMNNRVPNGLPRSQIAFIEHIVIPMYQIVVPLAPELGVALTHAETNLGLWRDQIDPSPQS